MGPRLSDVQRAEALEVCCACDTWAFCVSVGAITFGTTATLAAETGAFGLTAEAADDAADAPEVGPARAGATVAPVTLAQSNGVSRA